MKIFETATRKTLWEGRAGETATFYIDKQVEIAVVWGYSLRRRKNKDQTIVVKAGDMCDLAYSQTYFTSYCVLRKVEMII